MKKRSKLWAPAREMPPLSHSVPGEDFDITHSEAAKWLVSRPEIMQEVFNLAVGRGDIVFNRDSRTWRGVDYDG